MALIRPFTGLRPVPQRAREVLAPPYDVLNTAEARVRAQGRERSFLHISKPEIDLDEGIDPYDPKVYAKGKENLQRVLADGTLVRDTQDCYYIYRLIMDGHSQFGLVAVASVVAYDSNRIRRHEFTRPVKEDDRVRHIDALNAQISPVFLTYRHDARVDAVVEAGCQQAPVYDLAADDGVQHMFWVVTDSASIDTLNTTFDAMNCLYIADGHHRSAAASRVAAIRAEANPHHTGEESYNYFLAVIFPDNQMQILDYNRVVKDLNGLSKGDFLQEVEANFAVTTSKDAYKPTQSAEFGMYLSGQWYRLAIKSELIPNDDPVGRLDASLLQTYLIDTVLGVSDPRRDQRIDFVGGIRGLQELERRVDSGEMAVAFALYATRMEDLMAVADADEVMPPKSTWFEPKLADGLISYVLD